MRKSNQEITDKNIIEDILSNSQLCRVAMIDGKKPYLLPFNYGYKDNCIYIHSAPKGKKIDALKKNREVCFEITQKSDIIENNIPCKWATTYRSVVGDGNIEIINEPEDKIQGLEIIMSHNGFKGKLKFESKQVDAVVILKLHITSITGKQSSNWNKQMQADPICFKSERLTIKETEWEDIDNVHKLRLHPEVDEYNTLGIPEDFEETCKIYKVAIEDKSNKPRTKISWVIFEKDAKEFVGEAGISLSADRFNLGEIYYNILPSKWGRGYATEIVKAILKYGFEDLYLHKIEAGVATENQRSIRVLEKAGMIREGLRRKILPIRGEWKDNYHYAIVVDEWNG